MNTVIDDTETELYRKYNRSFNNPELYIYKSGLASEFNTKGFCDVEYQDSVSRKNAIQQYFSLMDNNRKYINKYPNKWLVEGSDPKPIPLTNDELADSSFILIKNITVIEYSNSFHFPVGLTCGGLAHKNISFGKDHISFILSPTQGLIKTENKDLIQECPEDWSETSPLEANAFAYNHMGNYTPKQQIPGVRIEGPVEWNNVDFQTTPYKVQIHQHSPIYNPFVHYLKRNENTKDFIYGKPIGLNSAGYLSAMDEIINKVKEMPLCKTLKFSLRPLRSEITNQPLTWDAEELWKNARGVRQNKVIDPNAIQMALDESGTITMKIKISHKLIFTK